MRRILHLALGFMLVLQGLWGTAMAAEFTRPLPAQTEAARGALRSVPAPITAHHTSREVATVHGSAPGDGVPPPACHTAPGDECTPHEHSPACSDCDICHSAVLTLPAVAAQRSPTTSVRPLAKAAFASAQAALAIKPPIL